VPNTKASTKAEAVKKVAAAAKKGSEPVSVRIHKQDGKIQEERTYPRGQIRAGVRASSCLYLRRPSRDYRHATDRPKARSLHHPSQTSSQFLVHR
jgi:hypothetical protein